MMTLYITPGSAYARMARIVVLEKGLDARVETVLARTRQADSPYYRISPSGRVPYLVCEDGVGLEESSLICAYLDHLDGQPTLHAPLAAPGWEARRLEAGARSLLDGLAVWNREILRPLQEQSPTVIAHEAQRAARMVGLWEQQIDHPLMGGALNLLHITLACALGLEARIPEFLWRPGHPRLSAWFAQISQRPALLATAPPRPA